MNEAGNGDNRMLIAVRCDDDVRMDGVTWKIFNLRALHSTADAQTGIRIFLRTCARALCVSAADARRSHQATLTKKAALPWTSLLTIFS